MDFCDSLRSRREVSIVQVGSENGGLESVLSLIRRLKAYGTKPSVHLIEPAARLMPNHPAKLSKEMLKVAEENKITVHLETEVNEVHRSSIELSNGTEIASDFTSVALPLEADEWIKDSGLKLHSGVLKVNHHLQASEHNVFAVGTIAIDPERPWPRSQMAAVKQAKVLFQNLKASVLAQPLKKYRPSPNHVEYVSDGDGRALLTRGNMVLRRRPLFWSWKVKRDQKFQNILDVEPKSKSESSSVGA
jgi:NADH dehydrogenase FAD-containing subunit